MYKTFSQNSYWISPSFVIEVFSTQQPNSTLCHIRSNYDTICSHKALSSTLTFVRAGIRNPLLSIWCGNGQFYCQHLLALTGTLFYTESSSSESNEEDMGFYLQLLKILGNSDISMKNWDVRNQQDFFLMPFKLKKRKSWYLFRYVQKSSSLFFSFSSPYFFFWNTKCETTSSLLNTFKFLFNQPLVFQKNSLDQNSTNSVLCAGSGSESRDTAQTSTSTPDFVPTQLYHRAGKQWPRTESQMAVKVISQPKTGAACLSPMQSQRNWVPPT